MLSRESLCNCIFYIFAYLWPALNSIGSVISEDKRMIKKQLIYWIVFSISSSLCQILASIQFFRHYPPEAKVIAILWLMLPYFNGATWLYDQFLQQFYVKYEVQIDKYVTSLSQNIQQIFWDKVKIISYVLLFNSGGNYDTYNNHHKSSFVSYMMSNILALKPKSPLISQEHNSITNLKPSYQRLRAKLREEFKSLLQEGIFLRSSDISDKSGSRSRIP